MRRYRLGMAAVALGLVGGAVAGGGHVGAQTPPAPRTLSIATLAPQGSTWMRVLDAWNREVRRRTNNALSFRFYPGGVQGDEAEVIRKIRSTRLDGAAVTGVGLSLIHRPSLVFQMPGMYRGYAQLDAARTALDPEIRPAYESAGFTLMGWAEVGQTHLFSNRPVRAPSELAGLRPWGWRDDLIIPAMYEVAGVQPVSLQVPEVLSALQTNRIDSFTTSPVASLALQWNTRATHMSRVTLTITIGATVFGKRQFDALPADQQTVLRETAAQFHQLLRTNLRRDEVRAEATLAQRGVTMVASDAAQQAQWTELFNRTRQRLAGRVADAAFINRARALGR